MTDSFWVTWGILISLVFTIGPLILFLLINRLGESRPWPRIVRLIALLEAILTLGLVFIGGGVMMIRLGLESGKKYRYVDPHQPLSFVIESMATTPGVPFPSYQASGTVLEIGKQATITIRAHTFHHRHVGETLTVYATNASEPMFVWDVLYHEASPFLTVHEFTFSWRLLLGIFLLVVGGTVYCGAVWYHYFRLRCENSEATFEDLLDGRPINV